MKYIYILIIFLSTIGAQMVTVQGVLRDNNNAAISDGLYVMSFDIYNTQFSDGSEPIWESDDQNVQVINGVYSLGLNIGSEFQSGTSELWLEITVNTEIMSQRVQLHISPYEQMILIGQSNAFPGSGDVGIGTTDPSTKLDVRGDVSVYEGTDGVTTMQIRNVNQQLNISSTHESGVAQYSTIETGMGTHLLLNPESGNVGIGTTSPDSPLTVEGNIATSTITIADRITFTNEGYWSRFNFIHPVAGSSPRSYWYGQDSYGTAKDFSINIQDLNSNTVIAFTSGDGGTVQAGKVGIGVSPSWPLHVAGTSVLDDVITTDFMHIDNDSEYPVLYGGENQNAKFLIRPGHGTSYRNSISIDGEQEHVGIHVYSPEATFSIGNRFLFEVFNHQHSYLYIKTTHESANAALILDGQGPDGLSRNVDMWLGGSHYADYFFTRGSSNSAASARPIQNGLNTIMDLNPIFYDSSEPNRNKIGFDALNVLEVIPELVREPVGDDDGPYGINYGGFTPVLTKAVQELKTEKDLEIEKLRNENNQLRTLIDDLSTRIERLENK